jgi:hypothetical protein
MTLEFQDYPDGSWRAQGAKRYYRITRVRQATATRFRVLQSVEREPGSGTQAVQGLHDSFEAAVAWCEAAERELGS